MYVPHTCVVEVACNHKHWIMWCTQCYLFAPISASVSAAISHGLMPNDECIMTP
eukprot:COSAG02_NODE_2503_length_8671_cov_20.133108_8_plen_54_part_00